ncbi:MAG: (E)-4-hydroxy-3-methylbut-2-enyl-diphosphate synthase [Puniceicoccales bacterium]|jgi:(E)-4-hydroxy-3-methylbut-2-enyl-diphosphate synthase|nr:(E)-4-hydroxy-3-methylbut-2-enyl-diphosphate synthase [Puniceicoccales bacterium]
MIHRRRSSKVVAIGSLLIGGSYPIRVQSMTNTATGDVVSTLAQIRQLADTGCEIVRLAIISPSEIEALRILRTSLRRDKLDIPLVADVHFSPALASAVIPFVDKLRINPGNFVKLREDNTPEESGKNIREIFVPLLKILKKEGKSLRLGVNHGSLSKYILKQYGNTVEGMLASIVDYLKIAQEEHFEALVLSFKANHVPTMVQSYREADRMLAKNEFPAYPFHLGVTEAGNAAYGRIKGAVGIGSLLLDGLGDTLRVSLTENPCEEISVAYDILQATGARISRTEYVACPTCGRTHFNLEKVFNDIKAATRSLKGIKIAVMGCGINGLGEMADADYACVGSGKGKVDLYDHGRCIERDVPEDEAVARFLKILENRKSGS